MINELKKYAENLSEVYSLEQEMGQYQYLIDIGNKAPSFSKDEQNEIVNIEKWKLYNNNNGGGTKSMNGFSRVDILVCTPGRLMDHVRHTPGFTLQHLRVLVVDEADRLMAQSYQGWVSSVLNASRGVQNILPSRIIACNNNNNSNTEYYFDSSTLPERQYDGTDSEKTLRVLSGHLRKLLFSATLTNEPDKMVAMNLVNPRFISLQQVSKKNAISITNNIQKGFNSMAGNKHVCKKKTFFNNIER